MDVDENHPMMQQVLQGSQMENEAMDADRTGNAKVAIQKYKAAIEHFTKALQAAPRDHADIPALNAHVNELRARHVYLEKNSGGQAPLSPLETQIKAVQLTMQASAAAQKAQNAAGGTKRIGAAAAIGAAGGLFLLGPIGAVAGIAGGIAAVTAQGAVGDAARNASDGAIGAAEKAKEVNDKHDLTGKMKNFGTNLFNKAKDVNDKHQITTKVSAGASAAANKAKEINEKHHITEKVADATAKGLDKANSALASKTNNNNQNTNRF